MLLRLVVKRTAAAPEASRTTVNFDSCGAPAVGDDVTVVHPVKKRSLTVAVDSMPTWMDPATGAGYDVTVTAVADAGADYDAWVA